MQPTTNVPVEHRHVATHHQRGGAPPPRRSRKHAVTVPHRHDQYIIRTWRWCTATNVANAKRDGARPRCSPNGSRLPRPRLCHTCPRDMAADLQLDLDVLLAPPRARPLTWRCGYHLRRRPQSSPPDHPLLPPRRPVAGRPGHGFLGLARRGVHHVPASQLRGGTPQQSWQPTLRAAAGSASVRGRRKRARCRVQAVWGCRLYGCRLRGCGTAGCMSCKRCEGLH